MSDFKHMIDLARVELTGASEAGIRQQVYEVLKEFFDDSSSWLEAITFTTTPAVVLYPLVPTLGRILRLAGVLDANNVPQKAIMPEPGTVQLRNPPNAGSPFTATVIKNVVLPTRDKEHIDVPDWLYPEYSGYLADGIIGRMMLQPSKSYTNQSGGAYHIKRFRLGLNKARVATIRRNTYGLNAWVYPQQFRTRGQKGGVSVGSATEF